jgi:hypothetical protein
VPSPAGRKDSAPSADTWPNRARATFAMLHRCNSCTPVQFLPRCRASGKIQIADDSGVCARHGYCPVTNAGYRVQP